jgi:hypothetical protein
METEKDDDEKQSERAEEGRGHLAIDVVPSAFSLRFQNIIIDLVSAHRFDTLDSLFTRIIRIQRVEPSKDLTRRGGG